MKLTAKKPDPNTLPRLSNWIWSKVVDEQTPFVDEDGCLRQFEMGMDPAKDEPVVMKPGERRVHVKQRQFLRLLGKFTFLLYGGAMRSGKSYIGLWACLVFLIKAYRKWGLINVRVGIFSDTYATLYDRQISMLSRYLPKGLGKWNDGRKTFKLKRMLGGGEIYFRNLDNPEKYKSVNFAMIFVEEINENGSQDVYDVLSTRLQWPGFPPGFILPFIATCNPGGPGHGWVTDLCINRDSDTYLKDITTAKGTVIPGVFFIHAKPNENPYLDMDYYEKLKRLPEKLYRAWVMGEWDVFQGQFFDQFEIAVHVTQHKRIPKGWRLFRAMDLGRAHPFVCLWGAVSPQGRLIIYREFSCVGKNASWCKRQIARMSRGEEYERTIGGHDFDRKASTPSGETTVREIFNSDKNGGDFGMVVGDKNRRARILSLYEALCFERSESYVDADGVLQMSRIRRRPSITIQANCKYLISSLRLMQHDEHDNEVYARTNAKRPGQGDDETDTLALLWSICEGSYIPRDEAEEDVISTLYDDEYDHTPSDANAYGAYSYEGATSYSDF